SGCARGFQGVHEHAGDVEARLLHDLLETGGAGDVDLRQVVADDVEAHQQQPFLRERGGQRLRDLTVAPGELPGDAGPAGREVAARLAGLGDAGEGMRHRLAGYQQDALVAIPDLRDVALRHDGPAAELRDGLEDDVEIGVVATDAKNGSAA